MSNEPNTNRFAASMGPAEILFSFHGRVPRRTYWLWGVLGLALAGLFLYFVLGILGLSEDARHVVANLALLWPSLAITVKRWHDRDKSAWWLLILLVPIVGALWALIECGFLRGTVGDNRYGADPTGRL